MAMAAGGAPDLRLMALFAFLLSTSHGATAVTFTFRNNCPETVWPATVTSSGPAFPTTGFVLAPGASVSFPSVGATWSGRVWGRHRCTTTTGPGGARFSCESGDCGTGQVACSGAGGAPPATLAEYTLGGGGGGKDFYDVSNVDGFNLPVDIEPAAAAGGGRCQRTSCPADINRLCPSELAVRVAASAARNGGGDADAAVVGCKSACLAFGTDEYCCRGQFASPATCKPSGYSRLFKAQCPQAYSYAYDDRSSTFTCNGSVGYQVTFCPGSGGTRIHAVLSPNGNN